MERKIEKKREKENGIDDDVPIEFFGVKTTTVYFLPSKVTPRCCCCCAGGVTTVMKHFNPVG